MKTTLSSYVDSLVASRTKVSLQDFVRYAEVQHNSEEISTAFMEYFFLLTADENEGRFMVPHDKLIEYGIATSTRSGDIKKRLDSLGLLEDEDYLTRDVSLRLTSGTKHSKAYMLTPQAFKLALIRAQRRESQAIDVTQYAKYCSLRSALRTT
jgi:hypothetical protein